MGDWTGELAGRVALISGAARGLGAAVGATLLEAGATVMITDVRDREGEALASSLEGTGALVYRHLDVTRAADWAAAVSECENELGGLDILVSNAFLPSVAGVEEESMEGWHAALDVILLGAFLGIRTCLPVMQSAGRGSIIAVSSTHGGDVAVPGLAAYQTAKGGLSALVRNAAVTYAADGIRANAVHPGPIRTPVIDELGMTEGQREMARQLPIGRVAEAGEVARTIRFLASDRSSGVTGASVVVDGGYTAL